MSKHVKQISVEELCQKVQEIEDVFWKALLNCRDAVRDSIHREFGVEIECDEDFRNLPKLLGLEHFDEDELNVQFRGELAGEFYQTHMMYRELMFTFDRLTPTGLTGFECDTRGIMNNHRSRELGME